MSGTCSKCKQGCVFKESKTELFGFPCDICRKIQCKDCANLSATEIRTLMQTTKRILPFLCDECLNVIKEVPLLKLQVLRLKTEVQELKENSVKATQSYADVLKFKGEAKALKGDLDKLEQRVESIGTQEGSGTIEPTIKELGEREKRASNIIVFGFPETNGCSLDERNTEERKEVAALLNSVDDRIQADEVRIYRLGKPQDGKVRPIKVVFKDRETAVQVLKQKKKLDSSRGIYIKSDLTVIQRNYLRNLVSELRRRTENGEQNLKIRYFNSVPRIVKSKEQVPKN